MQRCLLNAEQDAHGSPLVPCPPVPPTPPRAEGRFYLGTCSERDGGDGLPPAIKLMSDFSKTSTY